MQKKGFTLVELLAVIVILAVIALIATPNVLNMIEMSRKGAAESSTLNYVDAVDKTLIVKLMNVVSNIDYNQKYSITGLTLTKYNETVGDIKPCLNKETNEQEDTISGNTCGETQKVNPNYLTFNIEIKGDHPASDEVSTILVKDNVVVEAKIKFGKYRVSYYYDKQTGDIRYCSTENDTYLSKEECNIKK